MLHYKHHEVSFIPFPFFSFLFSSFLFLSVVVALQSGVKFPLLARKFGSISQYVSGCRSIGSAALCSNQSRFYFFFICWESTRTKFHLLHWLFYFFFYKTWNFFKIFECFLIIEKYSFLFRYEISSRLVLNLFSSMFDFISWGEEFVIEKRQT